MELHEKLNKAILNLTNSIKALHIATQELNNAADKIGIKVKPKLEVIEGG